MKTSKTNPKNANINFNLNLSSSTPLQALAAKARRASAIEQVRKRTASETPLQSSPKKKKTPKQLSPLERTLRNLKAAFNVRHPEGKTVVWEKPNEMSTAAAIICIYSDETRAAYEVDLKRWKERGKAAGEKQPKSPLVETAYVLYASPTHPDRLGSVCIYGTGAETRAYIIRQTGHIFGISVRSVEVKMGRRLFVDVTV